MGLSCDVVLGVEHSSDKDRERKRSEEYEKNTACNQNSRVRLSKVLALL